MPVIKKTVGQTDVSNFKNYWTELANELRAGKEFGQPMILEEQFPRTGLIGVTVIWDRWADCTDADRSAIITKAYEFAELEDTVKRLAFAVGFTVPEAADAGVLPWEIQPLLKNDEIRALQGPCVDAMKSLGASSLTRSGLPRLRLDSLEQAMKYKEELTRRVPGTEAVWSVSTDMNTYRGLAT